MTDFRSYNLSASSVLLNRSFIVSVFLLAGERVLFSPLRHFLKSLKIIQLSMRTF